MRTWKFSRILTCALTQEQLEIMLQNSKMDTGHSWDLEKKTSGIMIMTATMKVKCFKDGDEFEKSGHPVFEGTKSVGLRNLQKEERQGHNPL